MDNRENSFKRLWSIALNYFKLNVQELKLTASEKVTVLLSATAVALILAMLAVLVVLFLSLAAVQWLASALPMGWAYAIVAGIYIVLGVVIFLLRKPLIIDPVARFISRVLLM
ncbi:MAG: phage holin family protein [Paramuribaculum sp.]|nr:phage holin family protein [Paramuribaculum sp.]